MSRYLAVLLFVQVLAIVFSLSDNVTFPATTILACDLVQVVVLTAILEKMHREEPPH